MTMAMMITVADRRGGGGSEPHPRIWPRCKLGLTANKVDPLSNPGTATGYVLSLITPLIIYATTNRPNGNRFITIY